MKIKFNQNKAITLVALVVTIVVLLVLASVTISMTLGQNGIITRSKEARTSHNESSEFETIQVAVLESIDEEGNLNGEVLKATLEAKLPGIQVSGTTFPMTIVTPLGRTYIITEEGSIQASLEAGLYNENGEMIIAWEDLLVAPYYLNLENDYEWGSSTGLNFNINNSTSGNAMYEVIYLLKKNNVISRESDVKEVIMPNNYSENIANIEKESEKIASETLSDNIKYEMNLAENTQQYFNKIGDRAFYGCRYLKNVLIGDSVTSIGKTAFWQCYDLENVTIGKNVKSIGEYAFQNTDLKNVIIPDKVESIGKCAFWECYEMEYLKIGKSVTSIGNSAFAGPSLGKVELPDTITSVGNGAFSGTIALVSKGNFNNTGCKMFNPTIEGDFAFKNNEVGYVGLNETAVLNPKNQTISKFYCHSNLKKLTINNGVTNIQSEAFEYCNYVSEIELPEGLTIIGPGAFRSCGITSLTIPDSVEYIGNYAFESCGKLTSVTIGKYLSDIGSGVFNWCHNIANISVDTNNTVFDSRNDCNAIIHKSSNTLLYGCKNTIIPNDITGIAENAFRGVTSLTSITIPNSVRSIGKCAFYDCSSLTSIIIPENVTVINEGVFEDCYDLVSVTFLGDITEIGYSAFYNCDSLTSITFPNSVKSIGEYAFYDCDYLSSATLSESLETIGYCAFEHCGNLSTIVIPNNVTRIESYAFNSCYNLTSVTLSESLETIGSSSFSNCTKLTSITIPESVTSIDSQAFYYCTRLEYVNNYSDLDLTSYEYMYSDPFEYTPWREDHPFPAATSTSTASSDY